MAAGPHTYSLLSVFSPERYKGNPLAVVATRGNALSQQRKSLIAREFGFSETVFLHDSPGPGLPRRLDIFTETGEEIPFAGHPVIGATHYIFNWIERWAPATAGGRGENERQGTVFMTKAGPVNVSYNPHRMVAACAIPHNFHVHKTLISTKDILSVQPQIQIVPTFKQIEDRKFPIASVVKGMTFALVDLTDAPEVLGALRVSETPACEPDADWSPTYTGAFYYTMKNVIKHEGEPNIYAVRARMICNSMEDPGTGSASCTLACYLALNASKDETAFKVATEGDQDELTQKTQEIKIEDGEQTATKPAPKSTTERFVYAIQQGVEMGRECTIAVEVDLKHESDGTRSISNVTLSGRAAFFARGELIAGN